MKALLIFILSLFLYRGNQYTSQSDYCRLLQEAVKSKYFEEHFRICNGSSNFEIYDKVNRINDCPNLSCCAKPISITHDAKFNSLSPNDIPASQNQSIIVLHRVEANNYEHTLYLWQPHSNAALNLTFKMHRDSIELTKYEIGVF